MAKDPAFSFYAQDYLVDTFQWDRASKSLHVDLLALSWINGYIEADAEGVPVGLNDDDKRLWHARVKGKWLLADGRLTNSRIEECRENRKKFLAGQSEKGKKSADSRSKKSTAVQPDTNRGSTVVKPGLNHLNTEIEIEEENELKDEGTGEGLNPGTGIVPDMVKQFTEVNQDYFLDQEADYSAVFEIAEMIKKWLKLSGQVTDRQNIFPIKTRWGELVRHIRADTHLRTYSIDRIRKHFQSIVQSFNTRHEATKRTPAGGGKSAGANELIESLRTDLNTGGKPGLSG